ncbi:hypothetical protein, partial [Streptomyces reticuliscabiei]|uniref:hypothetical protein n=1 Tax=Streptomyces reticuliscabiei TaxID=146821 RepID=UPI001C4FF402
RTGWKCGPGLEGVRACGGRVPGGLKTRACAELRPARHQFTHAAHTVHPLRRDDDPEKLLPGGGWGE